MKFENVLDVLTKANQDIANAKASVENCETFHALYDAALESHPVFIKYCNNTNEVRALMQEAIGYAVAKMIHKGSDSIIFISENKRYIMIDFTYHNETLGFNCFDEEKHVSIFLPIKKINSMIYHGKKINITP